MPEIPLVVDDGAQTLTKTRKALDLLQRLGAAPGEHIMNSAPLYYFPGILQKALCNMHGPVQRIFHTGRTYYGCYKTSSSLLAVCNA